MTSTTIDLHAPVEYLNRDAVLWVLCEAPNVPPHLVATLIGLAKHADADGRGARPSHALLAWYARKSEKSVGRDIDQLEELRLIERGDQRLTWHLPPNQRPVVWNLCMSRRRGARPEPSRGGRPRTVKAAAAGEEKPARCETGGTPTSPRRSARPGGRRRETGGTYKENRGDVDVPRSGLEDPQKKTNHQTSSDRPGTAGTDSPPQAVGEDAPTPQELAAARQVLEAVQDDGRADPVKRVRFGSTLATLSQLVVERLRAGWTPADLTKALSGELVSVRGGSVFGALRVRLLNVGPPPQAAPRVEVAHVAGCLNGYVPVGDHELPCSGCRPAHFVRYAHARGVETFDQLAALYAA